MKLNKKKGFTIVELVIVIAVIAILAAVLIPNISKLVKKANASADESLVRNLNTALAMDTEKHATMSDALKAALDNGGYDVAKIVTKDKDNKILWDSVNDCFVYLKKGDEKPTYIPKTSGTYTEAENYQLFEIVDEVPALADQKYSIYLSGEGKTVESKEVSVGFDSGKNTVKSLTYTNTGAAKEDVIIYTNGGTLTVNAANDTVKHYGTASYVYVQTIHTESYHEYGKVDVIKVDKGHIEVESKANVGSVEIGNAATSASISVKLGATVSIISKGNTNSTIDNKSGKEIHEATDIEKEFSVKFEGGFGTAESPYLVINNDQFDQIYEMYKAGNVGVRYFSLLDNINAGDLKKWDEACDNEYSVVLNGNGFTISAAPYSMMAPLFGNAINCEFNNLKLTTTNSYGWSLCYLLENVDFNNVDVVYPETIVTFGYGFSAYSCNGCGNINFIDCDIKANVKIDNNYAGLFIGNYINGDTNCKFVNCTFEGEFRGPKVSMFIGNEHNADKFSHTIVVENCSNYGNIVGTVSATYFSNLGQNSYKVDEANAVLQNVTKENGKLSVSALEDGSVTLTIGQNNEYILNSKLDSKYSYKVSLVSSISLFEDGKKVGSSYVMIDKSFKDATNLSTGMYKASVISDNLLEEQPTYGNDVESLNNRHYVYDSNSNRYIIETNDGMYDAQVNDKLSALVYVYDESGTLVATIIVK